MVKLLITELRTKKKMSRLQLSKLSGVARGYICELEDGKYNNPTVNVICKLCQGLGCTPNDLIDCENYTKEE